jgi:hypothetical protein
MARCTNLSIFAVAVALLASAATCGDDGDLAEGSSSAGDGGARPAGSGSQAGADAASVELHDCDLDEIACDAAQPECPEGEVPSVNGACYGPCVGIESCACNGPDDCPLPEQYNCHLSAGHCGPYV